MEREVAMYLIPPMDDEPPPPYIDFVAAHLGELRRETDRLVGGDREAGYIYMEVLADLAGHWRRLCWLSRLRRRDAVADYVRHRLATRTRQWRDDQIYEVDIRVLRTPDLAFVPAGPRVSLALRKAAVLPGTVRSDTLGLADAEIAWVHAYQRHRWRQVGRLVAAGILLVGGLIQYMSWVSAGY